MEIKNVTDLRDITITKEEYIRLGEINKFLERMPWNFQGTLKAKRYVVDKIEKTPKPEPKPAAVAFDSHGVPIKFGDRVIAVISKGRVVEIVNRHNVRVLWDEERGCEQLITDAIPDGLTVIK